MSEFTNNNNKIKELLNKIGSGFCLAKWTQTTIHLGLGHTHSCHHPRTHVIPIEEIKKNPSALHNTSYKKQLRKEMLEGNRPPECNYCWNIEDLGNKNEFSDRILKSGEDWSWPFYQQIAESSADTDFSPAYVEISFSNVCNFKCSYCMPSVSSQWMEEVQRYGGYPTSTLYNNLDWVKKQNKMPILHREENPYVEAFWKWWPDLYKEVQHFRITGGEPLLDKNTFKVLDYVIQNPNTKLELSINSNLCVPDDIYLKFIEKIKIIETNKCLKAFTLYTSCEGYGKSAEYIRFGLDYTSWKNNFLKFLAEVPNSKIIIMSTYNALSVTSFDLFLEDVLLFKQFAYIRSKADKDKKAVYLDIPYLNNPPHQNVKILNEEFLSFINQQIEIMKKSSVLPWGYENLEIHKIQRIKTLFQESLEKELSTQDIINRKDFVAFVDEHDKRRGTNFLETFPEMEKFYNYCKSYK